MSTAVLQGALPSLYYCNIITKYWRAPRAQWWAPSTRKPCAIQSAFPPPRCRAPAPCTIIMPPAISLLAQAAVIAYPDGIKCLQDRLAISFASSPDAFAA